MRRSFNCMIILEAVVCLYYFVHHIYMRKGSEKKTQTEAEKTE